MKSSGLFLILSVTIFVNVNNGFAQDSSAPANSPTIGVPESIPQPGNVETPSAPEAQPPQAVLTVPMEAVPVVETNQEVVMDSHIIIESVPVAAEHPPVAVDHGAFGRIKQLAGRWEGMGNNFSGEKQEKIVVTYEITAGGHAVMERIFPGTSQEMITMYIEQNGQLTLLHFCMIGTRSMMSLKPIPADIAPGKEMIYEFSLSDNIGLNPDVDTHMHSLKISFVDENKMTEEWTMFEAGKSSGSYTFNLTRIPAGN